MSALIKARAQLQLRTAGAHPRLELHAAGCESLTWPDAKRLHEATYYSSQDLKEWLQEEVQKFNPELNGDDPTKHVMIHECFEGQVKRKHSRHEKNKVVAGMAPKSARFFRVQLHDGTIHLLQAWERDDGMFVGWSVQRNGQYEVVKVVKEVHRIFHVFDPADVKRKQQMVMDLDTHTIRTAANATRMDNRDAKETNWPTKRSSYVLRKRAKAAERRAARAAAQPKQRRSRPKPASKAPAGRRRRSEAPGGNVVASGTNHETGTVTQVLDERSKGGDKPWTLQCVDHDVQVAIAGKREAKRMRAHPKAHGWCPDCKKAK